MRRLQFSEYFFFHSFNSVIIIDLCVYRISRNVEFVVISFFFFLYTLHHHHVSLTLNKLMIFAPINFSLPFFHLLQTNYRQYLEFSLKLGYSERLVQQALKRLVNPTNNELLAELIKLGATTPGSNGE